MIFSDTGGQSIYWWFLITSFVVLSFSFAYSTTSAMTSFWMAEIKSSIKSKSMTSFLMGSDNTSALRRSVLRFNQKLYLPCHLSANVLIKSHLFLFSHWFRPALTVVEPIKSSALYIEVPIEPSQSQINAIQFPLVIQLFTFSIYLITPLLRFVAPT